MQRPVNGTGSPLGDEGDDDYGHDDDAGNDDDVYDGQTWLKSQLTGRPSRFWTGLTSQRGDGVWVWDYPTGQTSDTKL